MARVPDLEAAIFACKRAQEAATEIDDATARTIGALWSEGMGPTQSFATTGAIVIDPSDLWREFFAAQYETMPEGEKLAADMLGTYLYNRWAYGNRGPVAGWSGIWVAQPELEDEGPLAHATVTLHISYDPTENSHPSGWDWPALLDIDPDHVRVDQP